jgi:starch-binding outer membrane protein, SusD/RagB family
MNSQKYKNNIVGCFLILFMLSACDLTEIPQSSASYEAVFGDEIGLQLYTNSFYNILPTHDNINRGDEISDFGARRDVPTFLRQGAYGPGNTDGWSWTDLRNINFFLDNNNNPSVPEAVRQHYNALARFFRAWFYFEKVKRYGDVPWIDKAMDINDPKLYQSQDSRVEVMNNVLADIDFAIQHLREGTNASRTRITRDVALALKSRIALFEGTFRKYHPNFGLSNTANQWLTLSVDASRTIMDRGNFSIYTGAGANSYRTVFRSNTPVSTEVMLVVATDVNLDVLHTANWWYTSSTYGVRFSFIRPFIHTYLNLDGTPFTNRPNYETTTFMEETKGRDRRLEQTIRAPGHKRIVAGVEAPTPPAFSYVYTGYHPIKWTIDDASYDGARTNTNAVPIFRYAEVLLNYAEAKAELGTLTDADWAQTIGVLRARAGITGGLSALPTTVDPYLQSVYFPNISDPVILEIRRERSIELVLEGFRFYDLVRWKRGELLTMDWDGLYIPQVNQYMDLNEDGTPDVYFFTIAPPTADRKPGVIYLNVTSGGFGLTPTNQLTWRRDIPKHWADFKYLYPLPESALLTNPSLVQNPGWDSL